MKILRLKARRVALAVSITLSGVSLRADIQDGLVGHWDFEDIDNPGLNVSDSGPDLLPISGLEEDSIFGFFPVEGIQGESIDLDGLSYLENRGPRLVVTTESFSWSLWVRVDSDLDPDFDPLEFGVMSVAPVQIGDTLVDGEEVFVDGGKALIVTQEGEVRFEIFDIEEMAANPMLADDQWHHIAVVFHFDAAEEVEPLAFGELYIDGALAAEMEAPIEEMFEADGSTLRVGAGAPGDEFFFGAWPLGEESQNSPYFLGAMDEVRVYNRGLEPEEIVELVLDGNPNPNPPEFLSTPLSGTGVAGRNFTLSARASGVLLDYQWFKNGIEIPDATEASLTIAELSLDDAGEYHVRVSNPSGTIESPIAQIAVLDAWNSSVGLVGFWNFDGENPGTDSSGSGVDLEDNGVRVVPGILGNAIETGPDMFLRDVDNILALDTLADFTWSAMVRTESQGNIMGVADQLWGPGNKSLFIRDDILGHDAGFIGDMGGGPVINDGEWRHVAFRVESIDGEYFQTLFVDGSIVDESDLPFGEQPNSGVFGIGFASEDFPEYDALDSPNLSGSIDQVRVYNQAVQDEDIFTIFVEDGGALTPPEIAVGPASISALEGRSARFRVEALGTDVRYEWRKDGELLLDATESTLMIRSVSKADAGEYSVTVISDRLGQSVTSEPAILTVEDAPNFGGGALAHIGVFLESYWNFDEPLEDGIPDLSPIEPVHDGILRNGAELTEPGTGYRDVGRALDTSIEENAHMAAMNPEAYDFNSSFTWTARVKVFEPAAEGDEAGSGIFGRAPADSPHNPGSKILYLNGLTLGFDTGWVGAIGSEEPELELDVWHQVTLVHDIDLGAVSIYLDSDPILNIEDDEPVFELEFPVDEFPEDEPFEGGFVNSAFRIGDGAIGFFSDPFPGLIDDVAVWSTALAAEDVALLADGASPLPEMSSAPEVTISLDASLELPAISVEFSGVLQSANEIGGDWEDVSDAVSPHVVEINDNGVLFFRARAAN